jgi:hypothetical protein
MNSEFIANRGARQMTITAEDIVISLELPENATMEQIILFAYNLQIALDKNWIDRNLWEKSINSISMALDNLNQTWDVMLEQFEKWAKQ